MEIKHCFSKKQYTSAWIFHQSYPRRGRERWEEARCSHYDGERDNFNFYFRSHQLFWSPAPSNCTAFLRLNNKGGGRFGIRPCALGKRIARGRSLRIRPVIDWRGGWRLAEAERVVLGVLLAERHAAVALRPWGQAPFHEESGQRTGFPDHHILGDGSCAIRGQNIIPHKAGPGCRLICAAGQLDCAQFFSECPINATLLLFRRP